MLSRLAIDEELFNSVLIIPMTISVLPKAPLCPRFYLTIPRDTGNWEGVSRLLRSCMIEPAWQYIRYGTADEKEKHEADIKLVESPLEILTRNCNNDYLEGLFHGPLRDKFYIDDRVPASLRLFPFGRRDFLFTEFKQPPDQWKDRKQVFCALMRGEEDFSFGSRWIMDKAGITLDNIHQEIQEYISMFPWIV